MIRRFEAPMHKWIADGYGMRRGVGRAIRWEAERRGLRLVEILNVVPRLLPDGSHKIEVYAKAEPCPR